MKSATKNILKSIFPVPLLYIRAFNQLLINPKSYLHTSGWLRSLRGDKPVDGENCEVPWMNYAVIQFLEERLKRNFHLFEFGSGYSTSFYAKRVLSVTSVEHDKSWYELVKQKVPENAELIYQALDVDGEYCRSILRTGEKYDVLIVDGKDRVNCIRQSVGALADDGVILLDDSHRQKYTPGLEFLKNRGFRALSFEGLKPTSNTLEKTTIFYRRENCFDI